MCRAFLHDGGTGGAGLRVRKSSDNNVFRSGKSNRAIVLGRRVSWKRQKQGQEDCRHRDESGASFEH